MSMKETGNSHGSRAPSGRRPAPVRVAVIGSGAISTIFLHNMIEKFSILDVVACTSRNLEKARAAAGKHGIAAMTLDEALADPSIELVVNLTPPKAHFDVIRRALEAGKHVYTEKVLATTVAEGVELLQLADRLGLELCSSPDTFLGSAIQNARQLVDRGMLGEITSAHVSCTRSYRRMGEFLPYLTQKGGDIGVDLGVYHLTALCFLLGSITSVFGFTRTNHPDRRHYMPGMPHFGADYTVEAATVTAACVEFESGALATFLFNSDSIMNQRPRFELMGTTGILTLSNPDDFGGEVTLQREGQSEPTVIPSTFGMTQDSRGAGVAEMAWAIRSGRPPRASKELALHVLEALLGIDESADAGRPHVMTTTAPAIPPLPEGHVADPYVDDIEAAFV